MEATRDLTRPQERPSTELLLLIAVLASLALYIVAR
jgi:hypothetical protein